MKLSFNKIYEISGASGFGCWFSSKERKLPIGTVRCIKGILFEVVYQHGTYWNPKTCWTPVDRLICYDIEKMRNFRNSILSTGDCL